MGCISKEFFEGCGCSAWDASGLTTAFEMLHFSCDILRHQKIDFVFLLANHTRYICSNFSAPLEGVNFFSVLFEYYSSNVSREGFKLL